MVDRFLKILHKEFGNINQAAFLLGFFAFLSQILGLFRDRILARNIGLSSDLDIYYAAFRIPDFILISLGTLVAITALIPFLTQKMDEGEEVSRKFMNDVFTVFFFVITLACTIIFFLMPYLTHFITPGFSILDENKVILVSRIMLLSPILLGLSNLFATITQYYKKFLIFALSPVLYNIGILIGVIFLYPHFGVCGLAGGVIIGALFHFSIQVPVLIRHKFIPNFSKKIDWPIVKSVISVSLPRTIGMALNSISLIFITGLATLIGVGSISVFRLSYNLQSVPLAIVGMSFSVAAFPTLVSFYTNKKHTEFVNHFRTAAKQIIFWSLPITFLFIVLRAQIVRVILGSGQFSWNDTRLVAASLAIFAVSVLSQGMILLFARGFFAAGKTKKPLIINLICSLFIVILAYLFLYIFNHSSAFRYFFESLMRVDGIRGTAVLMLPLAYTIGTTLNFILHWIHFKRDFIKQESFIRRTFLQSLGASFIIGFITYQFLNIFDNVFKLETFWGVLGQGFFAGILGIVAGIFILKMMKSTELSEVWQTVHSKFWKAKIVVPEEDLQ